MENFESLKKKLIRRISESSDRNLIDSLYIYLENYNPKNTIAEPQSIYDTEKPMTDEEVEGYFPEEKVILPLEILEILKASDEDVKASRVHTNDEIEAYFDEWLKD